MYLENTEQGDNSGLSIDVPSDCSFSHLKLGGSPNLNILTVIPMSESRDKTASSLP